MSRLARDGTAILSRESKFKGSNGDRGKLIFPVELTTSRIGNLRTRRLILYKLC